MTRIIKNGALVPDRWQRVEAGAALPADDAPLILPLPMWLAHRGGRDPALSGVWLAPDDDPDALLPALAELPVIAIHFPVFTDGRGYSLARLLRGRHGYRGELRAFGDVLRDQMYFLRCCGFDSFCLRADQALEEALTALDDYAWMPLGQR